MDELGGLFDGLIDGFRNLLFIGRYYQNQWLLYFAIALAVVAYVFIDSYRRRGQNFGFWRAAVLINLALFIPTIVVALGFVTILDLTMLTIFAYMGIASGIIALGLGIGYFINFRGAPKAGPEYGANAYIPPAPVMQQPVAPAPRPQPQAPYKPPKVKVAAWVVMKSNGKNYQLNQGTTTIGRSKQSDIPILNDPTVSGQHIKIVEENGHYTLYDLGSTNGTWVNGYKVRQPMLLDINDEIRLGDNTFMKFVAS